MELEGSIPNSQHLLHLCLSWARPIQSTSPHSTSTRFTLILSTHLRLGLHSGLIPSGFPTNNLYASLFYPIRATCPAHLILALIILIILGEEYKSRRSSLCDKYNTSMLSNYQECYSCKKQKSSKFSICFRKCNSMENIFLNKYK
jgi:hypothetical protein